jgi:large subunit ribosomal protein L13
VYKTYYPKASEIERKWFVVDANGENLGRLATRIAGVLLGKHKPTFTPGVEMGDYVIVVNAERVTVTGTKTVSKMDTKMYHRHSGYPGGLTVHLVARSVAEAPRSCFACCCLGHAAS